MIVCQATGGDKVVLILGLSHANLGKLKEGQPIKITRESHGLMIPAELAIVISAAPTEEDMYRALVERGLITGGTVHDDRRSKTK